MPLKRVLFWAIALNERPNARRTRTGGGGLFVATMSREYICKNDARIKPSIFQKRVTACNDNGAHALSLETQNISSCCVFTAAKI